MSFPSRFVTISDPIGHEHVILLTFQAGLSHTGSGKNSEESNPVMMVPFASRIKCPLAVLPTINTAADAFASVAGGGEGGEVEFVKVVEFVGFASRSR
jgi:hypothetical protein